ncbi:MAG TPA: translation initiation factor IF-3 [bacterium]|nr:translation initiation factor IF-3 [bacterium]
MRVTIKQKQRLNEQIQTPNVRLIDERGGQMGILATTEALAIAEERGYDLVEVAPEADPPVCKLVDFDKLRYERKKQQEKARKMSKKAELKEIRLSPNTSENDVNVKINQARKFIEGGDKVKATIKFMGREITHPELGRDILQKMKDGLRDVAEVELAPSFDRRMLYMIFKPGKEE